MTENRDLGIGGFLSRAKDLLSFSRKRPNIPILPSSNLGQNKEAEELKIPVEIDEKSYPHLEKIEDIFTSKGLAERRGYWVIGPPVSERSFIGKREELKQIQDLLEKNGVAVVESGYRSGKSSLMKETGKTLTQKGIIAGFYELTLGTGLELKDIQFLIDRKLIKHPGEKLLITVDEIGFNGSLDDRFFAYLEKLKANGHKIILSFFGDYAQHPAVPFREKAQIARLFGDSVVVNKLMPDEDIRLIINRYPDTYFSKEVEDFLVKESGGHPLMAQFVSDFLFDQAKEAITNRIPPDDFFKQFITSAVNFDHYMSMFEETVNLVIEAGLDPLTFQTVKETGVNREVYENMLPKTSSTIYETWVRNYLANKKE